MNTPFSSPRSFGLAEGLNPAKLAWDDIREKSMQELVKLSPAFTSAKNNGYDPSFEALVKAAGDKKLTDFTLQDVSALTIALAHNLKQSTGKYDAQYTALMKEIWRYKTIRATYPKPSVPNAGVPRKHTLDMTLSELFKVATEVDNAVDKISKRELAALKSDGGKSALKDDLVDMARRISALAKGLDNRDEDQKKLLRDIRPHMINVLVRKWPREDRNDYRLTLPVLRNSTPQMEAQAAKLESLFKGHGVGVAIDFANNCRFMFVTPERGSDMDVVLHALSKEGRAIGFTAADF